MADHRAAVRASLVLVLAVAACRSAPLARPAEERPSLTLLFSGNVLGEIAPCG